MADVTVVSSTIVQPENINQSFQEKIHLTPFDLNLLHIDYTQRGLLFPKPDPETRFISRLKTSLSSALHVYFPFAGCLVKVEHQEDKTVSFHIDCNGSGARFVHAIAESVSVSDLLQPDGSVPEFFKLFFPMNGVKSINGVSEPLLAVQVTEIKDGVFIGFGYNHMVADGVSIWNFFRTWSKICKNGHLGNLDNPIVLKGWFLDGIDCPIQVPFLEAEMKMTSSGEMLTKERVFHFTKENVSYLKAKVNGEIGLSDMKVSSLQAVSALMWRSIFRHSGFNREEEVCCNVAVDLRQRLNPPLDKECFGHVIYNAKAKTTVGELQEHGLGWVALKIGNMLRSLTNEDYTNFAEGWVKNVKVPKFGGRVAGDSIIVSGSPRFEVYDNDFGWGKPIAARAGPGNSISGKLVLFRGIEDGSIDVHATLSSDVLASLLADVEFVDNVTII